MVLNPILFDLDGTLTDPYHGITRSVQFAVRELGHAPLTDDVLRDFIGPPLQDSFRRYLELDEAGLKRAVEHYRVYFAETGIHENELYAGIPELLDALSKDRRLVLATSKPTVFAKRILDRFGLAQAFHSIIGSELDGTRVAKSEVVAAALEAAGMPATTAVMIGDRRHDIEGARTNGVRTIAVAWGYGSVEELASAGPDEIVETPSALHSRLVR